MSLIKTINELATELWAIYDKATDKVISPATYKSKAEAKTDFDDFFDSSKHEIRPFTKRAVKVIA